jgi:hypothetical protein
MARNIMEANNNYLHNGGSTSFIPSGPYCYNMEGVDDTERGPLVRIRTCPYWALNTDDGEAKGYCAHLKASDGDEGGPMFLFDHVKECGVNDDDDSIYERQEIADAH